ncbi:hypothetical protein M9458_047218, partial [Cirrhinus mrigala]
PVSHCDSSTGEGGQVPWRLVQDRHRAETRKASRADQGAQGVMVEQTVWEAMAGQGARGAMVEQIVQGDMADQAVQEVMTEQVVQEAMMEPP